jgi:alpha-pyrone synthase
MYDRFLPTIESIATGTPPHVIYQADAARFVANIYQQERHQQQIDKIYKNTRIETRKLALDLLTDEVVEFCQQPHNLDRRMELYVEHAVPLATEVARKALAIASSKQLPGSGKIEDEIGIIVYVTSTGIIAPGVDAKLIENLGLRRNIARIPINFMGCAAALTGLRAVCDYLRAYPQHKALMVCLELSSVNSTFAENMNDLVIHSIFGDGCAAVVLGTTAGGNLGDRVVIRDNFSYLVEDTADGIRLDVRDNGISCTLSPQLPGYIESGVAPIINNFLASHDLTKTDIDLWAVHPGGTRIIEKVQASLGLKDESVADSWEILREYGNMLSCAVLFTIERMLIRLDAGSSNLQPLRQARSGDRLDPLIGLAFSFSPGVGIEGILFEKY